MRHSDCTTTTAYCLRQSANSLRTCSARHAPCRTLAAEPIMRRRCISLRARKPRTPACSTMAACRMASHCWRSWRPRHTAWMRQVADVRTRARRLSSAADAPARRNTLVRPSWYSGTCAACKIRSAAALLAATAPSEQPSEPAPLLPLPPCCCCCCCCCRWYCCRSWSAEGHRGQKKSTNASKPRLYAKPAQLMRTASITPPHRSCWSTYCRSSWPGTLLSLGLMQRT
mmetsp:Transcript_28183/g.76077  ORF Transcript_28183/g.76077 Transcript_28183/m.76077 type:complete len:228 (+) Transcript_28183:1766-2449(+)